MSWSFDCDVIEAKVQLPPPAKRAKTQERRTSAKATPLRKNPYQSFNKRNDLDSLPGLLRACEPRQPSELSVSRQKQREICDWLEYKTPRGKPSALIISGPSGCGKTLSFKLLAKERGFEAVEWITPSDQGADENNRFSRQGDKFEEFVVRTTRYGSILDDFTRRLLLVKDFPNVYINDKDAFYGLLDRYFRIGKEPIVFICTDSGGVGILQTLFPANIKEQFGMEQISINPVTQVVTKNILKRVASVFNSQASQMVNVSQKIIEEILSDSIGDIRSTILNLIFASLKIPESIAGREGRGRGESLSLLHAVGRVTNPKRIAEGNSWKFVHDPDEIAYFFQTQPSTFVRFVHENHLNTTREIEAASTAADVLSVSDCLVNEWRDASLGRLGLSFCIRGIMTANDNPVSAWNPVRKPRNDNNVSRDLSAAEISWYKSLIIPQQNSAAPKVLSN